MLPPPMMWASGKIRCVTISEQNAEYSARLLRAVSYDGIQNSVQGHSALVVPEDVKIVPEVSAPKLKAFKAAKYHLPLMSGY